MGLWLLVRVRCGAVCDGAGLNRFSRLHSIARRAGFAERESWWLRAFCFYKLSEMGRTDTQIAEQFEEPPSHDTVRNARNSYACYDTLRKVAPAEVRFYRRKMDKSKFETLARYHPEGGADALLDLASAMELTARDFEANMKDKYRGSHKELGRQAAMLQKSVANFVQDFLAHADANRELLKLARNVRAAGLALDEQLGNVRDALREQKG